MSSLPHLADSLVNDVRTVCAELTERLDAVDGGLIGRFWQGSGATERLQSISFSPDGEAEFEWVDDHERELLLSEEDNRALLSKFLADPRGLRVLEILTHHLGDSSKAEHALRAWVAAEYRDALLGDEGLASGKHRACLRNLICADTYIYRIKLFVTCVNVVGGPFELPYNMCIRSIVPDDIIVDEEGEVRRGPRHVGFPFGPSTVIELHTPRPTPQAAQQFGQSILLAIRLFAPCAVRICWESWTEFRFGGHEQDFGMTRDDLMFGYPLAVNPDNIDALRAHLLNKVPAIEQRAWNLFLGQPKDSLDVSIQRYFIACEGRSSHAARMFYAVSAIEAMLGDRNSKYIKIGSRFAALMAALGEDRSEVHAYWARAKKLRNSFAHAGVDSESESDPDAVTSVLKYLVRGLNAIASFPAMSKAARVAFIKHIDNAIGNPRLCPLLSDAIAKMCPSTTP
ncbi:MAG: hypothetical protein IPH13_03015 [Planctomycetes bacterium]|nr:hypothetical protein [Planctomycetota bacterium]MCC7171883.1 hypothetical protein [Planctomycetota bacterium]